MIVVDVYSYVWIKTPEDETEQARSERQITGLFVYLHTTRWSRTSRRLGQYLHRFHSHLVSTQVSSQVEAQTRSLWASSKHLCNKNIKQTYECTYQPIVRVFIALVYFQNSCFPPSYAWGNVGRDIATSRDKIPHQDSYFYFSTIFFICLSVISYTVSTCWFIPLFYGHWNLKTMLLFFLSVKTIFCIPSENFIA